MESWNTFVVSAITWAVAPLILLSTGPLMMGSGTESKLWGKLKKNKTNTQTNKQNKDICCSFGLYINIKTYLALLWGDCSPFSEHSSSKQESIYLLRDGQSGKLTVDDYGAKTGRSPGKMRQLNINGPLYVGLWSSLLFQSIVIVLILIIYTCPLHVNILGNFKSLSL